MNLYQKLVEIQKSVRSLAKGLPYANFLISMYPAGKVLDAVKRKEWIKLGVLLVHRLIALRMH